MARRVLISPGTFVLTVCLTLMFGRAAAAQGSISGTISNATTAAPVQGVRIRVYDQSGNSLTVGPNSAADGTYTINLTAAGTYYLRTDNAQASGFVGKLYNNATACSFAFVCNAAGIVAAGTPVVVTNGQTTSGRDFALTPGGTISGTVTDAANSNGITSVIVNLFDSAGGSLTFSPNPSATGAYSITGIPAGTYFVRTSGNSVYVGELYDNLICPMNGCGSVTAGKPISVTAGNTTANINFALDLGSTITGAVTEKATGNGIASVNVQIFNAAGSQLGTSPPTAAGTGSYTVNGLPPGTYYARTNNTGNYVGKLYNDLLCLFGSCIATTGTPIVIAAAGETKSGISFALDLGNTVTGTITDAATSNGVPGASVQLFSSTGQGLATSPLTAASGVFTIIGVAPGTYFARMSANGGYIAKAYDNIDCALNACVITTTTPFTVTAGQPTSGINFPVSPGGTVSGKITDAATSNGIANAQVQLFSPAGAFLISSSNTSASGSFSITGVPAATYYAKTNNTGYINKAFNDVVCTGSCNPATVAGGTAINVTVGAVSTANFALDIGGKISGKVTDAASNVLANLNVRVLSNNQLLGSANTNAFGIYTVAGLPTGLYNVATSNNLGYLDEIYDNLVCLSNCTASSGASVSVTFGQTTPNINFALAIGGRVAGKVTNASTTSGVQGIQVRIYNSTFSQVDTQNTNGAGNYTSRGLPPGTYYVNTSNSLGLVDELFDDITCLNCPVGTGTGVAIAGTETKTANFALTPGGRITGTVTNAAGGAKLPNVNVQIFTLSGTFVTSATTSNIPATLGEYSTTGLSTGTYLAKTNTSSFINQAYDGKTCVGCTIADTGTPINVTLGSATPNINFSLSAGATISGTVTDGTNPLSGVNVQVYNALNQFVTSLNTSASGQFTLGGLVTGTYFVRTTNQLGYIDEAYNNVICSNCNPTTTAGVSGISVTTGVPTTGINFALALGGKITGLIKDAATNAPLGGFPGAAGVNVSPRRQLEFSRSAVSAPSPAATR